MATQASNSGIVTDSVSGERHIPESVRADGTTRKAIKIRPGYQPPEDVKVYKNRTAETFRNVGKGGIPGAESVQESQAESASSASAKNAKRREARKKAKAQDGGAETAPAAEESKVEEVDPEAEKEKKARNLKKKLKQARELKDKKEGGETLLPEQIAKVIKISELIRELESLGFSADDGTKGEAAGEGSAAEGSSTK